MLSELELLVIHKQRKKKAFNVHNVLVFVNMVQIAVANCVRLYICLGYFIHPSLFQKHKTQEGRCVISIVGIFLAQPFVRPFKKRSSLLKGDIDVHYFSYKSRSNKEVVVHISAPLYNKCN